MSKSPQIPQHQQPFIQDENKKIDRVWYNFLQLLSKPKVLSWTTSNRPTNIDTGYIGYNTTTSKFEGYDGTNWINLN